MNNQLELDKYEDEWIATANTFGDNDTYEAIVYCKNTENFYMLRWELNYPTMPPMCEIDWDSFDFETNKITGTIDFVDYRGNGETYSVTIGERTVELFTTTDNEVLLSEHEDTLKEMIE